MANRRQFLSSVGKTLVGSAAAGLPLTKTARAATPGRPVGPPNVLFISIDDINDWIGVYGGHPDARTPHLDAFARRGVMFSKAYCSIPLCYPSRIATFTGIRPASSGVHSAQTDWRRRIPNAVHLPQHFRRAGYETIAAGKVYHYTNRYEDPGETWLWDQQTFHPLPEYNPELSGALNGVPDTGRFDWGPLDVPEEEFGDHVIVDWCVERLQRQRSKPFFMACGIYRPHMPWYAPRKYFDLFSEMDVALPEMDPNDLDDVPPWGVSMAELFNLWERVRDNDVWPEAVTAYLACIAFADAQVGRLLQGLADSPHADNTIIVLWSDHGYHLGEKLHWEKNALWEEATRIPLMIHVPEALQLPGSLSAGTECARTVELVDLFPTLTDLCGLGRPDQLDGASLTPLLSQPDAAWDRPAISTWLYKNHTVRTERWRYIKYRDGTEELYDHDTDPLEWNNLAGDPAFEEVRSAHEAMLPTDVPYTPLSGEESPGDAQDEDVEIRGYPSPSVGPVTIEVVLRQAADISLTVFSVLGQRIQRLVQSEPHRPGTHRFAWDGRDESGQTVAGGVYLCVVQTPAGARTHRIVLLP